MKRTLLSVALMALSLSSFALDDNRITTMDLTAQQLAYYMAPGWNLGNTLEAGAKENNDTNYAGTNGETAWGNAKTTQEMIDLVKASGFKSIRIPCSWVMGHISAAATSQIDAAWMARVKEVVDYAIKADLYVIINDHWDGGWLEDSFKDVSDATVKTNSEKLARIWKQIANEFKDYDERLIFAGLNEPAHSLGLSASAYVNALKQYEEVFIQTVRATGGNNAKRVLVVQGPSTNIDNTYDSYGEMPKDAAENRLMLEIHSYDPWDFCGMEKDETWDNGTKAYMRYYWGTGHNLSGAAYRNATDNENTLLNLYKKMQKFTDAGVPVVLGEFGAFRRNIKSIKGQSQKKHDESVAFWYEKATQYAMECGMIPFAWDQGSTSMPTYTLFNRQKVEVLDWNSPSSNIQKNGALEGIMKGAEAGKAGYDKYYGPSSTGISMITSADTPSNNTIYNLAGIAVGQGSLSAQAPKGIYISNGKKFVVK